MYNPAGSEFHNEFVEIYNSGTGTIDLSGFKISDSKGEDDLILVSGSTMIDANQYALILDASYFENSNQYDALIPSDIPIFKTSDNTIGSGGLSNSTGETVLLIDDSGQIVDSITYLPNYPNGFSFEHQFEFGSEWGQSLNENGTPGFKNSIDRYIELIELRSSFDLSQLHFDIQIINRDNQFRSEIIESELFIYKYNLNGQFSFIKNEVEQFNINLNSTDSTDYQITIRLADFGQYHVVLSLTNQSTIYYSDSTEFIHINKKFPILLNLIRLERPQLLRLYNQVDFPFYLNSIELIGSGSWKTIPIDTHLNPKDVFILSKHTNEFEAIFDENIPFLNSVNGSFKIRLNEQIDSIKYQTDEIPFYDKQNGIIPRFSTDYNSDIVWIANPYQNKFEMHQQTALDIKIVSNPFSPNGDGIADMLEIKLNYNEFDLVQLKIFSLSGQLVREVASQTYTGVGTYNWDGRDEHGNLQITGPYILYFKGKLINQGKELTRKIPIVLVR